MTCDHKWKRVKGRLFRCVRCGEEAEHYFVEHEEK